MVQASVIQLNHARTHWTQNGTSTLTCKSIYCVVGLCACVDVVGVASKWQHCYCTAATLHTATSFDGCISFMKLALVNSVIMVPKFTVDFGGKLHFPVQFRFLKNDASPDW